MSDKNSHRLTFRLNDYLFRFISSWASERNIETSEAIRLFCQNYYMDFMRSEMNKKSLMPIEQKREKFLALINTLGASEMKRLMKSPEICSTMNGYMTGGKSNGKPKRNLRAKNKA